MLAIRWYVRLAFPRPTLPQKLNYLHWIEDLLELELKPPPPGSPGSSGGGALGAAAAGAAGPDMTAGVVGIDIGTGASCIYPLLGTALHAGWVRARRTHSRRPSPQHHPTAPAHRTAQTQHTYVQHICPAHTCPAHMPSTHSTYTAHTQHTAMQAGYFVTLSPAPNRPHNATHAAHSPGPRKLQIGTGTARAEMTHRSFPYPLTPTPYLLPPAPYPLPPCLLPLPAVQSFVGTELNDTSHEFALRNVQANGLAKRIEVTYTVIQSTPPSTHTGSRWSTTPLALASPFI